jgi:hypothetical protein
MAWHTTFLVQIKKGEVPVRIDRGLRSWLVCRPLRPQADPIGTGIVRRRAQQRRHRWCHAGRDLPR